MISVKHQPQWALGILLLLQMLLLVACQDDEFLPIPTIAAPQATVGAVLSTVPPPAAATPLPTTEVKAPRATPTILLATSTPSAMPTASVTSTPGPYADPTSPPAEPMATAGADRLILQVAAMRDADPEAIDANASLPFYDLQLGINPLDGVLTGTEQIEFTNYTVAPLDNVALRLYPNFPADVLGKGGATRMEITDASVDGQPVAFSYAVQRTAVLLPLSLPLDVGKTLTMTLGFWATLTPWGDGNWPLPSYYPILAVHDAAGWRIDLTRFPDRVYAASAFYKAAITLPSRYKVAATGSTIEQRQAGANTTLTIVSGPVREFAVTVGDFNMAQAQAGANGDVTVNVYRDRRTSLDAAWVAQIAAGAITDYDRRFGRYPYRELDIHLQHGDYEGGDEYPGLILLYATNQVNTKVRYYTAHEVAHQWWYGVIGNDIFQQPWLDEALAQYSGIVYAEDVLGPAAAADDWQREVLRRYQGAIAAGDLPVGLGIGDFPDFNTYYRTIYGKGAYFLHTLRETIGDAAFFGGLQNYYQQHRYGIATTFDLRQALATASGRSLADLFQTWVGSR